MPGVRRAEMSTAGGAEMSGTAWSTEVAASSAAVEATTSATTVRTAATAAASVSTMLSEGRIGYECQS